MAEDEAATVTALKGHQAVVLPLVEAHGGRIQDTAGDGILAEFRSVQQAVECAIAIQRTMAERNAAVPPSRQMRFRIGVNLGDVMYDGTRAYGDGLNVAARVQALAEPGGICVTALVREEVGARTSLVFEDLGAQRLKNIPRPSAGVPRPPRRPGGAGTTSHLSHCAARCAPGVALSSSGSWPWRSLGSSDSVSGSRRARAAGGPAPPVDRGAALQ